jgi:hypothetical protein
MTENIILLGVLFLGGFVGLILGLVLRIPNSPSLKLGVGIIGAALGGARDAGGLLRTLKFRNDPSVGRQSRASS